MAITGGIWVAAGEEEGRYSYAMRKNKSAIFTAVFEKVPEGYIGFVEELPGANTQGATLAEARENLQEAIQLVLEANRELAEESIRGRKVLKERLVPAA